jgi:hypothetical protein
MKRGVPEDEGVLVERVKKYKGNRMGIPFPHVCEGGFCKPECEPGGYVYVCDYGAVHVCLPDRCDLAVLSERGEWVCPLSGLVLGVDDEEPAMERNEDGKLIALGWKLIKEKPKASSKTTIEQRARQIVETLFFGRARNTINQTFAKQKREEQTQQKQRYIQEQRRRSRFVSLPYLYRIDANTVLLPLPYKILDQNSVNNHHVDVCIHTIKQVWDHVVLPLYALGKHVRVPDAHNKPHMDQCIFGVLALMWTGHELVQFDKWVWKHLPSENDMRHFHLAHVKFKSAKMVISRFYDLLKQSGIAVTISPAPAMGAEVMEFKPTTRGTFCKKCRVRYFDTHVCPSGDAAGADED